MLHVVAFPPARRWWQLWRPPRPFLLRDGLEYRISPDGEEVEVFRPRRGWTYRVAYITP